MNEAEIEREVALNRVANNSGSWLEDAMQVIVDMCISSPGIKVTGEDIRLMIENKGIVPHHHNAWGALIRSASMRGLIHHTNTWRSMKTKKSHARKTPVYIVDHYLE